MADSSLTQNPTELTEDERRVASRRAAVRKHYWKNRERLNAEERARYRPYCDDEMSAYALETDIDGAGDRVDYDYR
jgi:hypothetical protein